MRLLLLLTVLICAPACSGGGDDEAEDKKPKTDPRTLVEVAPVARGSVADPVSASGAVESEIQASLVPETSGQVASVLVEVGDEVRRGQLLGTLTSPTLSGAYERASAALANAQADATSAQRLFDQGALSRSELDASLRALKSAELGEAEAQKTRGFTRIVSPIDGVVATRNLRVGEIAGGQAAFVVVDPSKLRLTVHLPEREISRVKVGQSVSYAGSYEASSLGAGAVVRVAPVVDATTGTFRAVLAIDDAAALKPGMFVTARIEVDRHEGVLTVPRRAVVWEEGRAYVYVVSEMTAEEIAKEKEDEKGEGEGKEGGGGEGGFSFDFGGAPEDGQEEEPLPGPARKGVRVAVELGFEDGLSAEIVSGVAEGMQVVVVGNDALRDGARVRLPGDPTVKDEPKDDPADPADPAAAKPE